MREGTVKPDGARIKQLRLEKGWTQEDLAEQAGCHKRTVENAEAGRPIIARTLDEIAQGLEVPAKAIIAHSESRSHKGTVVVVIAINGSSDSGVEENVDRLVDAIASRLRIEGRMKIVGQQRWPSDDSEGPRKRSKER